VADAETARAEAGLDIARLQARLGAAQAWIDLYFAQRRVAVLERIVVEGRAMAEAARGRLGGGAGGADEAIAAEVEAARLEDRRDSAAAQVIAARAELRRWIGGDADQSLSDQAPVIAIDPARLRDHLSHHPELAAFAAEDAVAEADLRKARAATAPDWSWSLMYQRRAPQFSDMASVEVRIGLPLFQPWRQGPVIDARRSDVARVAAQRQAVEREHAAMLEGQLAEYVATQASLGRARQVRLPLARSRADALAGSLAGGAASAAQMIAARRDALDAELDVLELEQRLTALGAAMELQYGEMTP
jgi:outer membrane protein TolC